MSENTRYSISGAILDDIVHAIQEKKNTTRQYTPEQIAGVIRKMYLLPASEAESALATSKTALGNYSGSAVGVIPVYQTAIVESVFVPYTSGFTSSAVGELSE